MLRDRSSWALAGSGVPLAATLVAAAGAAGVVCGIAYHVNASRKWVAAQAALPPPRRAGRSRLPLTTSGGEAGVAAASTPCAPSAASPTVVFVHGMGCGALEWAPVTSLLPPGQRWAALDRVLNVDARALAQPRSAEVIIAELREALASSGIPPPYILVGHSYGGLIVRAWALQHRAETAALLLIDPLHEGFIEPPMPLDFRLAFKLAVPTVFATLAAAAPLGLARLLDWAGALGLPPSELLPPPQRAEAVERYSQSAPWRIAAAELAGSVASLPWVRSLGPLDAGLPVTVVVAGRRDKSPTAFPVALTAAFVAQAKAVLGCDGGDGESGDGSLLRRRLVVAERSEHWVHLCEPARVAAELGRLCREVGTPSVARTLPVQAVATGK